MKNKIFFSLLLVSPVLFMGQGCTMGEKNTDTTQNVSSFDECVAIGNLVMESYPRQCRTNDGRLFVEETTDTDIDIEVNNAISATNQPVTATTADVPDSGNQIVNTATTPNQQPQDSQASVTNPNGINFGQGGENEEVDINSLYDANGNYYTDPNYDPTNPFDIDAYNNNQPTVTVPVEDNTIYSDPNACSPEGASYSANDTTYYCVDGIWTMSDYVYPYQNY